MNKYRFIFLAILVSLLSNPVFAQWQPIKPASTQLAPTITLVNHYNENLDVEILSDNGLKYTPDFTRHFKIHKAWPISSRVLISGHECQSHYGPTSSTFIHVYDKKNNDDNFQAQNYADFGVGLTCQNKNHVFVAGYLGQGIAYSWTEASPHVFVYFCSSLYYGRFHTCQDFSDAHLVK